MLFSDLLQLKLRENDVELDLQVVDGDLGDRLDALDLIGTEIGDADRSRELLVDGFHSPP